MNVQLLVLLSVAALCSSSSFSIEDDEMSAGGGPKVVDWSSLGAARDELPDLERSEREKRYPAPCKYFCSDTDTTEELTQHSVVSPEGHTRVQSVVYRKEYHNGKSHSAQLSGFLKKTAFVFLVCCALVL